MDEISIENNKARLFMTTLSEECRKFGTAMIIALDNNVTYNAWQALQSEL